MSWSKYAFNFDKMFFNGVINVVCEVAILLIFVSMRYGAESAW